LFSLIWRSFVFSFDAISFVNSCLYWLGNWNLVQKIITYTYVFPCFPHVVSGLVVKLKC
jgi:hypothetical protein